MAHDLNACGRKPFFLLFLPYKTEAIELRRRKCIKGKTFIGTLHFSITNLVLDCDRCPMLDFRFVVNVAMKLITVLTLHFFQSITVRVLIYLDSKHAKYLSDLPPRLDSLRHLNLSL